MKFEIVKLAKEKSYPVEIWSGTEVVSKKVIKCLAAYNVKLHDADNVFEFEIREDEKGNIYIDDDDDILSQYLSTLNFNSKEKNALMESITVAIFNHYKNSIR